MKLVNIFMWIIREMRLMKLKEILADTLKKTTDKMTTSSTASLLLYGVEEMPKSLKERR